MLTTPFLVLALLAAPQQLDSAKNPQTKPSTAPATEFEKSLTGTNYHWTKDKDGDYKIELNWDDEKRSQLVFIRGTIAEIISLYTSRGSRSPGSSDFIGAEV